MSIVRQLLTEDNRGRLCNLVASLKLDINTVRYRLSGLGAKDLSAKPKVLDPSPAYEAVGAHCRGVP